LWVIMRVREIMKEPNIKNKEEKINKTKLEEQKVNLLLFSFSDKRKKTIVDNKKKKQHSRDNKKLK